MDGDIENAKQRMETLDSARKVTPDELCEEERPQPDTPEQPNG